MNNLRPSRLNVWRSALIIVLGVGFPIAFYLGVCWLLGFTSDDTISVYAYAGGSVLVFLVAAFFFILGESIIEDWIKLGMVIVLVVFTQDYLSTNAQVVALGLPIGAALRLLVRLFD
jgi:hypothetical protein